VPQEDRRRARPGFRDPLEERQAAGQRHDALQLLLQAQAGVQRQEAALREAHEHQCTAAAPTLRSHHPAHGLRRGLDAVLVHAAAVASEHVVPGPDLRAAQQRDAPPARLGEQPAHVG
jgi:hypothetical protein